MHHGRLIRVSQYRRDPNAIAYIVAIAESVRAVDLIRSKFGGVGDTIEDLGRVSGALLMALNLESGSFVRV